MYRTDKNNTEIDVDGTDHKDRVWNDRHRNSAVTFKT